MTLTQEAGRVENGWAVETHGLTKRFGDKVAVFGNLVAEEGHGAAVGARETEEHSDQRGLAGAVRAEVAEG